LSIQFRDLIQPELSLSVYALEICGVYHI